MIHGMKMMPYESRIEVDLINRRNRSDLIELNLKNDNWHLP